LDGAPSALLKMLPTPGQCSSEDRPTGACPGSPSGTMSAPLTGDRGEGASMSSAADSRARTSAQQVKGKASTVQGPASGQRWPGSFARFDPLTASWKTAQCLLLGGSELFKETWPKWGRMIAGVCWELTTLAPTTRGTGSGSWPTPIASDSKGSLGAHRGDGRPKTNLAREVKMWPTPTVRDCNTIKKVTRASGSSGGGTPLVLAALGKDGHGNPTSRWPTPRASMQDMGTMEMSRYSGTERKTGSGRAQYNPENGGQLNPTWVEWLMGWPLGWTDLKPLEMGKFQQWLRLHGVSSEDQ